MQGVFYLKNPTKCKNRFIHYKEKLRMSILQFTPKTINQDTITEVEKLQQHYKADNRRFYLVTRHTDEYQQNSFDMLFFKEIIAYHNDPNDKSNILTLISLDQWVKFMGIKPEHADKLIVEFLSEKSYLVEIHINDEFLPFAGTDECCYSNFDVIGYIPLYLINDRGELDNPSAISSDGRTIPVTYYYISLSHVEAIELIFITYSKCINLGLFDNQEFIETWESYLRLIRENALAENLEQIHQGYWLSLSPELGSLSNTTKGVN